MDLKNLLGQIQPDGGNLLHGTAPFHVVVARTAVNCEPHPLTNYPNNQFLTFCQTSWAAAGSLSMCFKKVASFQI
jgi:hypothetical protein